MAEQWKVGDVVQLKSGGPIMTVVNVGDYPSGPGVNCAWFDNKKHSAHVFPPDALKRYVEEVGGGGPGFV
jgi:uncharacterized protein YodC (DUF2158 family)